MTTNYYFESSKKHITDLFETGEITPFDVIEAIENTELVERIQNKMRSMESCEHKFVHWFIPRILDCNCGDCYSCVHSESYFETVESHLNMFDLCTCKVCMHYWSVCDKYNWQPFQYTEDERFVQMRNKNKYISTILTDDAHVKRRRIDAALAVPVDDRAVRVDDRAVPDDDRAVADGVVTDGPVSVACEPITKQECKPERNPDLETIVFDRIAKLCETDAFYPFKLADIFYRVQIVKKFRVYAQKMKQQHGNAKWYPIYFLRRTNNCECTCGVNACCLGGNDFFGTVQKHFDIDICSCPICICYQQTVVRSREDGQYFRLTPDKFLTNEE